MIFETASHWGFGPITSALMAGYIVIVWGEIYVTPLGELYLARLP